MSEPAGTPYDGFRYPCHVHSQTHPDRLASIATFAGLSPAHPDRCRVLELGCGDGTNLIAMAFAAPESRFVGIDLAATSIAAAKAAAADLGVSNVEFHRASIAELPDDLGQFDYIASHGVYSWVPVTVRDALLAATRRHLAPMGVAYVSYSVYPGAYVTRMLREMMLFHVRAITDDAERVRQSVGLLKLIAASGANEKVAPWTRLVESEVEGILRYDPGQLRHDELGEINDPVWWREFIQHAASHSLAFLSEADWFSSSGLGVAPDVRKVLAQLGPDRVTREQYLDFCTCRRFRQTLLVRAGTPVDVNPPAQIVRRFFIASPLKLPDAATPLAKREVEQFEGPSGGALATDAPLVRAAVRVLVDGWPCRMTFDELVTGARRRLATEAPDVPAPDDEDVSYLKDVLLQMFGHGLVRLHLTRPVCALDPPERPIASRLARGEAKSRNVVTTLYQENVQLADGLARALLVLLDGTRDRAQLVETLRATPAGAAHEKATGAPLSAETLEAGLRGLARLGLIEG